MTRICFIKLYAYILFKPSTLSPFGGSEVWSWVLGVGLSKLPGNEVSFVVFDQGHPELEQFDRVKVYRHSHYKSQPAKSGSSLLLSGYWERSPRFPFCKIRRIRRGMLAELPVAVVKGLGSGGIELLSRGGSTFLWTDD